ncbi:unnamed protein product [Orchesella dallaii]|uniref:Cytochrome P450 4aa1 n=1 Tax=Orchesella dallaii TaxID=48710 RepID=A0ABP1QLG0_9HEXA
MEQQITKFNTHSDLFVEKLKELFKDGKPHSIHKLLGIYAIQSVVDSVVSLPNCSSDADADQFADNFKIYTEITSHRLLNPWLILGFIWRFHRLSPELNGAVQGMNNFAKVIIQKHMDQIKKMDHLKEDEAVEENTCLITQMLKVNASFEEIQTEVTTMLFAHESNTLSLLYFLLMLALHPEHQEKCRAEADELFNETHAHDDAGSFDFNSVSRLKHLERCFLETLRILPPVFMYGRKLESPLRLENNVLLPPGMNVYVCPLVMHKDEIHFPNPDSFKPDRFLPEECKKRHPYAFLPFSAGPRICLGMKSATFSIKILVTKILHNFEIVTEDKFENLKFRFSLTMGPEKEPAFIFIPRNKQ